jgi:hypothetical protein
MANSDLAPQEAQPQELLQPVLRFQGFYQNSH